MALRGATFLLPSGAAPVGAPPPQQAPLLREAPGAQGGGASGIAARACAVGAVAALAASRGRRSQRRGAPAAGGALVDGGAGRARHRAVVRTARAAAPGASPERCYAGRLGAAEAALLEEMRGAAKEVASKVGSSMMWGVDLSRQSEAADIVLLKFLRAGEISVPKAAKRLEETLRFRKDRGVDGFRMSSLAPHFQGHDTIAGTDSEGRPVLISRYGMMDNDRVFGDTEAFVTYRLHVMEELIRKLSFKAGEPETLCQVHDYSGVPLLFKTSEVNKAVSAISKVFGDHYPETKGTTIFVNFPMAFSKIFQAFSNFLPEKTRKKFIIFGDADQELLFQYIRPEWVPEVLGGMFQPGGAPATAELPARAVSVPARETQEVVLADVGGPTPLLAELRICNGEGAFELVFVPHGGGAEVVVRDRRSIEASQGVISAEFTAPAAGTLRCRFTNDRAWFQSRLFLCRAAAVPK